MELVVATRSAHKLEEIRRILGPVPGLRVLGLEEAGVPQLPEEAGLEPYDTFEENARSKAEYFAQRTGRPTVADDSGIEVDALDGAPGVRSKRFAPARGLSGQALDDANNAHLVHMLDGVEPDSRGARYVCVAVLTLVEDAPLTFRGEAPGVVLEAPRGQGGFGYDPYVFDSDVGRTFAEMSPAEKDERSHRGKAFRLLATELRRRMLQAVPGGPAERAGGAGAREDG